MVLSKPLLHPPLSEVAFEISFPRQFLVENKIAEYQKEVEKDYPHSSDEFIVRLPPVVAFGKAPRQDTSGLTPVRSFVFQNPDGSRKIKLSVVNLNFLVTNYKDFEDYKNALLPVLSSGFKIFQLNRVERIGLRYINKISVPIECGVHGYQDYVRSAIDLSPFTDKQLIHFLTEVRLEVGTQRKFTVRGGLVPADSDAPNRIYLLDLDCYSEEAVTAIEQDLPTMLEEFHDLIEAQFIQSVTEKYRNYMEKGDPM